MTIPTRRPARADDRAAVPPQRTVVVVAPYYPPRIGGVENYAARIARAAAEEADLQAVVITSGGRWSRTTVSLEDGVRVVRLGWWLKLSNTPLSPLWPVQVRRWLRETGAAVVNVHAPVP